MRVLVPVTPEMQVDDRFGRARRVAIFEAEGAGGREPEMHDVGWDVLRDSGAEGLHHARVARFLIEHHVRLVVAHHMGSGMREMLGRMGIGLELGVSGEAAAAVAKAVEAARTR